MHRVSPYPSLPGLGWLREPVNALTHGVGVLLGAGGLAWLVVDGVPDAWKVVSGAVYGATMIAAFLASTLLHALKVGDVARRRLRVLDHAAIFLLIAGTYTPVTLVTLRPDHPGLAWALFGVVWGLALVGIVFKVGWIHAPRWTSTLLYLGLGWLAVAAFGPMVQALPPAGIGWLVAGGVTYSVGAVIYATKRPDPFPKVFGYHEVWHLFVLGGCACHFVFVARYVFMG